MKKQTLEQIIIKERKSRHEKGAFGIIECKKEIQRAMKYYNKSLFQLLEEYLEEANTSAMFNRAMILACWELINNED